MEIANADLSNTPVEFVASCNQCLSIFPICLADLFVIMYFLCVLKVIISCFLKFSSVCSLKTLLLIFKHVNLCCGNNVGYPLDCMDYCIFFPLNFVGNIVI